MWTRKSVKEKGKKTFKRNYWKCFLVAIILGTVLGSAMFGSGFSSGYFSFPAAPSHTTEADDSNDTTEPNELVESVTDFFQEMDESRQKMIAGMTVAVLLVIIGVFFVIALVGILMKIFLYNPIEYGCRKFFRKNLDEPAKIKNIFFAFGPNYKNVVKTAFLTNLFISLWSLLFFIPGIIKEYEYRLVPYLISEDPTMNWKDAQAESKKLMKGNKWRCFVLDLSFFGWEILSAMTANMLGIFFVNPYKYSTEAALYESIKYGIEAA